MIRKNLGKGKGRGYYNLIPTFAHDRHTHQLAGKGIKSPQKMSTLKRRASVKLVKALRRYMKQCPDCVTYSDRKRFRKCPKCANLEFQQQYTKKHSPKFVVMDKGNIIFTAKNEVEAFKWLQAYPAFMKDPLHQLGRFKIKKQKGGKDAEFVDIDTFMESQDKNATEGSESGQGAIKKGIGAIETGLGEAVGGLGKGAGAFIGGVGVAGEEIAKARRIGKEKDVIIEQENLLRLQDELNRKAKLQEMTENIPVGGKCTPSQLKHGNDPDSMFNKSQLKQGIKVELEHTNDKALAKGIAKAHLNEDKAYYTKLRRVGL